MAGQAYTIGSSQLRNEVYIPGADGQFVSGFVDLMKSVASNVGGGAGGKGDVYNIAVNANDYAGGQEAGRGAMDEIMAFKRARGLA
jgi:hypothetical protein